jgi:hypothetical protein
MRRSYGAFVEKLLRQELIFFHWKTVSRWKYELIDRRISNPEHQQTFGR